MQDLSPIWVIGNTRLNGDSALIEFPKAGTYVAQVLIPTTGVYHPQYWLENFIVNVNAPPVAVITGAKEIISPGDELLLSGKGSYDPEDSPLRMQWFINDESRGNQQELRFSSLIPGLYEVRLIVNDGAANSACNETAVTKTIRVNAQPYAEISGPRIHGRTADTKFTAVNDFDSDQDKLFFTWDGTGIVGSNKERGVIVNHNLAGDYAITLTVDDQTGSTNSTYSTVFEYHVNAEPVPVFAMPLQAAQNY
jgi:hypothetical protein